jgi:soluble lytic murein transglycosylase-like protein
MHRRFWLWAMTAQACAWTAPLMAGAQQEEELSDSVRTALTAAVTDRSLPHIPFDHTHDRIAFLRWLGANSTALARRIINYDTRTDFLRTLWYEAKRAGLDPALVLGLIQVESGFKKYAISSVGARGYMQVMPFWMRTIGNGQIHQLFHTQTNLRFGCVILRHYLNREGGNLFMALGRYNGSRGKAAYPSAVLKAEQYWRAVTGNTAASLMPT